MPEVSVIVPVYNVEAYVAKCIDSILAQTFADYELILVNDGATDGSPAILHEYAGKDARISVIDKPNGGLSDARNAGMKQAAGEYLCFIDSDDFIEPQMLEKTVRKLHETGADIVMFDVYQYHMMTGLKEVIANPFDQDQVYSLKETPELITKILNAAWNKVYRRSLFTDNGIEYPKGYLYEDLGTTYRLLARADRVAFVNEPLYDYLVDRPGNITRSFNRRVYDILKMAEINLEDFRTLGLADTYHEELKYLCCVNILECLKKTRDVNNKKLTEEFIDACFTFIRKNWPEFPQCRYEILRQKNDWIYADPKKLKAYLMYRRWKNKGA